MISQVQLQKRKAFARDWRKEHVAKYGKLPFMFSDEKIFTVNGGLNRQNDRVFAFSREQANMNGGRVYLICKKFSLISVIFWAVSKISCCLTFKKSL